MSQNTILSQWHALTMGIANVNINCECQHIYVTLPFHSTFNGHSKLLSNIQGLCWEIIFVDEIYDPMTCDNLTLIRIHGTQRKTL